MADADCGKFHLIRILYLGDNLAKVLFKDRTSIGGQGGVIDRRAVTDYDQNLALLEPGTQTPIRPRQCLAVDVLFEQSFAQHQAETQPRAPPGRIRRLVNDVA